MTQPSLLDAITAADRAIAQGEAHADQRWLDAAWWHIRAFAPGTKFLAEDIAARVAERGITTHDARALGSVMRKAAKARLIEQTRDFAPARTSHGSPRRVWRRTGNV